jgi:chromosome segregation ATPase
MDEIYQQALKTVQTEIENLQREKTALEERLEVISDRLGHLEKTEENLGHLVGPDEEKTGSLTEAISEFLKSNSGTGFTPIAIRDDLRKREFPIDEYKNPLAVIHTTLKRLEEQEKIHSWEKESKKYYAWVDASIEAGITDSDIPF